MFIRWLLNVWTLREGERERERERSTDVILKYVKGCEVNRKIQNRGNK